MLELSLKKWIKLFFNGPMLHERIPYALIPTLRTMRLYFDSDVFHSSNILAVIYWDNTQSAEARRRVEQHLEDGGIVDVSGRSFLLSPEMLLDPLIPTLPFLSPPSLTSLPSSPLPFLPPLLLLSSPPSASPPPYSSFLPPSSLTPSPPRIPSISLLPTDACCSRFLHLHALVTL